MSTKTKELKSLLHESIENIDDEGFLQTVKIFWIENMNLQKG